MNRTERRKREVKATVVGRDPRTDIAVLRVEEKNLPYLPLGDSDAVLIVPPKKQAISIRVDEDVLNFFKKEGDGYQRRINAVLRSYMQQKAKPKKRA